MRLKLVIGLIALLLTLALGLILASREPEYGGRSLGSWLGDLDYGMVGFNPSAVSNAESAVREIGPRGVPTLIDMMSYRESSLRARLQKVLAKQKIVKMKEPLPAERVQWRGARGAWVLGPGAKAAIPELIILLTNQSTWVRGSAAMALGKIGTNAALAVPALVKALDDPNPDVRTCTAIGLGNIGPAAVQAIPALVRHFTDSDPQTRDVVVGTFLSITADRSVVLPYLVRQLTDGLADMRGRAAGRLGYLGRDAQPAVPELRKLLDDPDKDVRRTVTNALSKIEGTETQSTNAPTVSIRFQKASAKDILGFYAGLTGKRVEIASEIRSFASVSIVSYEALPTEKAIELIEQELSEQANIMLVPAENGVILARHKRVQNK